MARVISTLPNHSESVNGIRFTADRGEMISDDIPDELAAVFATIKGYRLAGAKPAKDGEGTGEADPNETDPGAGAGAGGAPPAGTGAAGGAGATTQGTAPQTPTATPSQAGAARGKQKEG